MDEQNNAVARRKAELVEVGEGRNQRLQISTSQFHVPTVAEYVVLNRDKWLTMRELARVIYHNGSPSNQGKVRKRMHDLFNHLLLFQRHILVYEFDGPRINAVKILDSASEEDRQAALPKIERMAKRCQWTQQMYDAVLKALNG